jgi:hypothetical protein
MVDSSCEVDLRGLEWVVGWEVYGKEEDAALEWTIALQCGILISHLLSVTGIFDAAVVKGSITYWTHNGSLPVELRKSRNVSLDPGPVSSYLDACGEHNKGRLTRSSPIGPAEHDEGGSLVPKTGQTKVRYSVALSRTSTAPLVGRTLTPR